MVVYCTKSHPDVQRADGAISTFCDDGIFATSVVVTLPRPTFAPGLVFFTLAMRCLFFSDLGRGGTALVSRAEGRRPRIRTSTSDASTLSTDFPPLSLLGFGEIEGAVGLAVAKGVDSSAAVTRANMTVTVK